MTRIDFSRAIIWDSEVIIKGNINVLKKAGRARMYIEDGIPVKIKKISKILMDELGHLGYIDYMSKVEIYKEN